MPQTMNEFIRTSACHPVEGRNTKFVHTFGGELESPVFPPYGKSPCHLLYTIDTEDPLFPVRIPGVRSLPLIYCFQYNAAAMAYRLKDGAIVIDWIEYLDWSKDFPYDDYPASFPQRDITLVQADLDTIRRLEASGEETMDPGSRFGGWHFLCQGVPDASCRNPNCEGGSMDVFGVIYNNPVEGVRLWSPDQDWDDIETIFQICRSCASIYVCNRCT